MLKTRGIVDWEYAGVWDADLGKVGSVLPSDLGSLLKLKPKWLEEMISGVSMLSFIRMVHTLVCF